MSYTIEQWPDGVIKVQCQSAEQVRDVLMLMANGHTMPTTTNGATTETPAKPKETNQDTPEDVLEPLLPLVEGAVGFDLVEKVAQQINWKGDSRALRSKIVAKRRKAQLATA